jgi:hypothetical protein
MHRLRIEAQPDTARAAKLFEAIQQRLRDRSLSVITDNDGVGRQNGRLQPGQ